VRAAARLEGDRRRAEGALLIATGGGGAALSRFLPADQEHRVRDDQKSDRVVEQLLMDSARAVLSGRDRPYMFGVRLLAFLLLMLGMMAKNRSAGHQARSGGAVPLT
jgi:hypothetical protein